jgi:hypothetical protein
VLNDSYHSDVMLTYAPYLITLASIYFVALEIPEKEIPVTSWLLSLNGVDMKQVRVFYFFVLVFVLVLDLDLDLVMVLFLVLILVLVPVFIIVFVLVSVFSFGRIRF